MEPSEAKSRRDLRRKLLEQGMPAEHVGLVVDLAFHAAERACSSLHDVVFSAPDRRTSITALGIALGLARERFAFLEAEMIRIAGDTPGLRVKAVALGCGAEPAP